MNRTEYIRFTKWFHSMSDTAITALRIYIEMDGNCSGPILCFILEKAYLNKCSFIVKPECRKSIKDIFDGKSSMVKAAA